MGLWNNIEQFYKKNTLRLLEKAIGKSERDPSAIDPANIEHVLVIRQHDYLGDFLLSTPVLRALREQFTDANITLVVRDYFADAALGNRFVNEVVTVPGTLQPAAILSVLRRLRGRWDLAVVLNTVSHSLTSDLIAHYSSAPFVLGSSHRIFPGCRTNFFYNLRSPYGDAPRHQTERNLDIVRYIGADTHDLTESMQLREEEIADAKRRLVEIGVPPNKPLVGMHLGAGKLQNRWPVDRFSKLAEKLRANDIPIVALWGPTEGALGEDFKKHLAFPPFCIQPRGLRELAALFKNCDGAVCNDTGVLHVCAAVGTPLVGIFGPTDPREWKPLGEKFVAVQGENMTTGRVSVEEVMSLLLPLIDRSAVKRR